MLKQNIKKMKKAILLGVKRKQKNVFQPSRCHVEMLERTTFSICNTKQFIIGSKNILRSVS